MNKFIKWAIGVVVVGGFIFLYATNRIDRSATNQVGRQVYYKARGAVGAAAGPVTAGAGGSAGAADQCKENLRAIERAKRKVAQKAGVVTAVLSYDAVAQEMGGSLPFCPSGGKYSIERSGVLPHCSIGTNNNLEPGDDHFLKSY